MSRKYNIETRMLKAYQNYTEQLSKRITTWAKKGYTPVDPIALSYEDYVANRMYLKARGVAAGNITRTIVSSQLYEYSQQFAEDIMTELKSFGVDKIDGKKITIESIKGGMGGKALSELNKALKAAGIEDSYERAHYITEHIYEDSI